MTEYEYEYYSAFQNWPNTNTNIIRASKNDRIRIRILFGSPKMTEYEYEYYSAFQKWPNTNIIGLSKNTNDIFFVLAQQCNIRGAFIHFSFWALKPVKAHYCAQRQNIMEYKRTIYFQNVQTECIFYWSPPKKVPSFVEWMIKSLQKVKIRVKTSHLIFEYVHFHFIGWDFATFNTKTFWGGTSKKIHSVCLFEKAFNYK